MVISVILSSSRSIIIVKKNKFDLFYFLLIFIITKTRILVSYGMLRKWDDVLLECGMLHFT